MKKIVLFLAFFCLTIFGYSQAEFEGNLIYNDYRNGNLNFAGDGIINVNKFTGKGLVSIPIYSGISLIYRLGGMTVDELASDVGLGWTLYTGGSIVRQKRGARHDEDGYWLSRLIDLESDIFYLSLNGRSIKVMFGTSTNEFITIPQSDIKIDRYIGGTLITPSVTSASGDVKFVVTDEIGNKYTFEKGAWNAQFINEWFLKSIVSYEGKATTYNYTSPVGITYWRGLYQAFGIAPTSGDAQVLSNLIQSEIVDKISLTSIDYPSGITVDFAYSSTPRCDIPSENTLSEITIHERHTPTGASVIQCKYRLNYAYFKSQFANDDINPTDYPNSNSSEHPFPSTCSMPTTLLRLKLKSIDRVGYDNSTVKPYYTFEYMNLPLPERVYGMKDKYGFANNHTPLDFQPCQASCINKYIVTSPMPVGTSFHAWSVCATYATQGVTVGSDHSSSTDEEIVGASSLNRVINGNGGEISITYKTIKDLGLDIGGLVVDRIKYYDGYTNDNTYSIVYNYSDGEHFYGLLEGQAHYWWDNSYLGCTSNTANTSNYCTDNTFLLMNTGLNGERYGFKTVTTKTLNYIGNTVESTINTFAGKDAEPSHGKATSSFIPPYGTFQFKSPNQQYFRVWSIGLPLTTKGYDINGNILNSVSYVYDIFDVYHDSSPFLNHYIYGAYIYEEAYYPHSGYVRLQSETHKTYYMNTSALQKTINYSYSGKDLISTSYINSLGETITENNHYSHLWSGSAPPAISHLASDGIKRHLYKDKWKTIGSTKTLIECAITGDVIVDVTKNIIRPQYNYRLMRSNAYAITTAGTPSYTADITVAANGWPVGYFRLMSAITKFDDEGNGIEGSDMNGNWAHTYNATIIDHIFGTSLANALNAKHDEIAYSGFESDYSSTSTYIKGNWTFANAGVNTTHALLGRCSYEVSDALGQTVSGHTSRQALTSTFPYTLSFWVYGTSTGGIGSTYTGGITVDDGANIIPNIANPTPLKVVAMYNGWSLVKVTFAAQGPRVNIHGAGFVDEVKVYPANSIMTTQNFLPLIGKTADVDANDNITTYEYDVLGNRTIVRDFERNIISKTKTVIQE